MDDFFTLASLGTLTGSVMAVVVIVNTIRHVFNWGPRWFGFAVSILISFIAFYITSGMGAGPKTAGTGWLRYFIIFVNGCLIYTSAFGIQNIVIARKPPEPEPETMGFTHEEGGSEKTGVRARTPW